MKRVGVATLGDREGALSGLLFLPFHRRVLPTLLFACLAGIAVGWFAVLTRAPFHEDEAIYAAWSLAASRGDLLLQQTPLDKPPLALYPVAAAISLFGEQEWAARLPAAAWTVCLLVVLWRIARLRGIRGAMPVLFALTSPLLWALAASVFTDAAMVALAFLGIERALARRAGQAGIAWGLAFLAKPTALFLAPLVMLSLYQTEKRSSPWGAASQLYYFLLAAAVPLLVAWVWDTSRNVPSWWALGRQAYGTLGTPLFAPLEWLLVMLAALGPLALLVAFAWWSSRRELGEYSLLISTRVPGVWSHALLWTAILWVPIHALLGFRPWERYLLPLVPVLVLFVTERSQLGTEEPLHARNQRNIVFGCVLAILLAPALVAPLRLEPHDGRWEGIHEVGDILEQLPSDAVVYYTELGRPLEWYAAGSRATLAWAGVDAHTFRNALATRLARERYFVARVGSPLPSPVVRWETVWYSPFFILLREPIAALP